MFPEKENEPNNEPVTPEMQENAFEVPSVGCLLPSAPKGKPRAPPLIHGRIKPAEAGYSEPSFANGSKIPLLKTKHVASQDSACSSASSGHQKCGFVSIDKHLGNQTSSHHSIRKDKRQLLPYQTNEVHRTVEKVKVSKGIEMKRVVQELNDIQLRKPIAATSGNHSHNSVKSGKAGTQQCQRQNRSMPSTETKNTDTAVADNGKPDASVEYKIHQDQIQNPTEDISYKTVEEFLKMPEVTLPDKPFAAGSGGKKPRIYKSSFWEYLDPASKKPTSKSNPGKEQKKSYNPEEVKSFIKKQKEMRRLQLMKDSKEKRDEHAKRQKMLQELDSKCQQIALKGKPRMEMPNQQIETHNEEFVEIKKPKIMSYSASPSMKYLKPLLARRSGSFVKNSDYKSEAAKQAQYLLSEFENIVKRECINFLNKMPAHQADGLIQTADKSVCTSFAFESDTQSSLTQISNDEKDGYERIPPVTLENAATKIQACFRGYKVRRAVKDAKVFSRHCARTQWLENRHSDWRYEQKISQRRWSFPRLPEKPYDNHSIQSKLLPMSPIPMVAISDCSVPCYIPPPPPSQTERSPSKPRVLPSFPLTPVRLRVYDEPYPGQSVTLTDTKVYNADVHSKQAAQSFPSITPRQNLENTLSLQTINDRARKNNTYNQPNLHLTIPTPLPSIVDVLREKVRLFVDGNKNVINSSKDKDDLGMHPPKLSTPLTYESDFESDSNISFAMNKKSDRALREHSSNVIQPITDNSAQLDVEKSFTPKVRRPKRHSRSRSLRSNSIKKDSLTTADTDLDQASTSSLSLAQTSTRSNDRSEETVLSNSNTESASNTFGDFLAPALRLRYEAEREHLQIIEKALQVKWKHNIKPNVNTSESKIKEGLEIEKCEEKSAGRHADESDRLQLAIANCQKESMKAAAEMAKWMAEFRKTTVEQDRAQTQQTPVDLAAMVYAAVEQARHIGEEKRREKERENISKPNRTNCNVNNADKSAETSLRLSNGLENYGMLEPFIGNAKELLTCKKSLNDYQQQFPSESEGGSPVNHGILELLPTPKYGVNSGSKDSSLADDVTQTKVDEILDYPSILPSGNSIEITSLELKVSTIEDLSPEHSLPNDNIKEASCIEESVNELDKEETSLKSSIVTSSEEEAFEIEGVANIFMENQSYRSALKETSENPSDLINNEVSENQATDKSSIVDECSTKPEDIDDVPEVEQHSDQQDLPYESTESSELESIIQSEKCIESESEPSLTATSTKQTSTIQEPKSEYTSVQEDYYIPSESQHVSIASSSQAVSDKHDLVREEVTKASAVEENISDVEDIASVEDNEERSLQSAQELVEAILSTENRSLEQYDDATFENEDISQKLVNDLRSEKSGSEEAVERIGKQTDTTDLMSPKSLDVAEDAGSTDVSISAEDSVSARRSLLTQMPVNTSPTFASKSLSLIHPDSDPEQELEPSFNEVSDVADSASDESPKSIQGNINTGAVTVTHEASREIHLQVEIDEIPERSKSTNEAPLASSKSDFAEELPVSDVSVVEVSLNQVSKESSNKVKVDVPLKPPPPYSPSSSLDSTSLSSRSLMVSVQQDKLERIVLHQANVIWEAWSSNVTKPFPDFQAVINMDDMDVVPKKVVVENIQENAEADNLESLNSAVQSFDTLLCHLVYETFKGVLHVENYFMPYIERVRPGPLALQAQKFRIPKTKENLAHRVLKLVIKAIPVPFFTDPHATQSDKPRLRKWCSRPRELVDEVLLEELVEEDYQWTEWWPEEIVVLYQVSEKIVKSLIHDTLKKRSYVFKQ